MYGLLDKGAQTGGVGGLSKKQLTTHAVNTAAGISWKLLWGHLQPQAPRIGMRSRGWMERREQMAKGGRNEAWGEAGGQWAADGPGGVGDGHGAWCGETGGTRDVSQFPIDGAAFCLFLVWK